MKRTKGIICNNPNDVISAAFKYLAKDAFSRIWSWNICFNDFKKCHDIIGSGDIPNDIIEHLSRSLACFLASWGMYRGSGDLLDRNYRQFTPLIPMLMKKEFWENRTDPLSKSALFEGCDLGGTNSYSVAGTGLSFSPLTCQKILSGVYGCVVPFDAINALGIRHWIKGGLNSSSFDCFSSQTSFLMRNQDLQNQFSFDIDKAEEQLRNIAKDVGINEEINLTKARLVDLYFYWIGLCLSDIKWLEDAAEKNGGVVPDRGQIGKKKREISTFFGVSANDVNVLIAKIHSLIPPEINNVFMRPTNRKGE